MSDRQSARTASPLSVAGALLLALLLILLVAGGASRADVLGQAVVRAAATSFAVVAILFTDRFRIRSAEAICYFVGAAVLEALIQLVPISPSLWHALPGRDAFAQVTAGAAVWRPISLVPSATSNAAASLLVPAAVLLLALGLKSRERDRLPAVLLGLVAASMFIGLLQIIGTVIDNPLINDTPGQIAGSFANRNHFVVFLALGCAIAPVWAFWNPRGARWRGPLALGLTLLFLLVILASGSRTGVLLGPLGLASGLAISYRPIRRALMGFPRWLLPSIAAGTLVAILSVGMLSVKFDRTAAIDRVIAKDIDSDMRALGQPAVIGMIQDYFPVGTGFGSFDPLFRMHEPAALLKPTYFNHAHNDFLEVVLDGGISALLLLVAAVAWWVFASVRVWRREAGPEVVRGRLGSAMLLLILLASAVDYPARTPMIMATVVLAALWLSWGAFPKSTALPAQKQHL